MVTQPVNKSLLLRSQEVLNSGAFDLYREPKNPISALTPYFYKIYFNFILHYALCFPLDRT